MEVRNLLEFLNEIKSINTLSYVKCGSEPVNLLDFISLEEEFVRKIDLGVIYLSNYSNDKVTVVDGLNRILSLSLLLHAICECYKKTTPRNAKAIDKIRSKYLLNNTKTKLILPDKMQTVYEKILFGEKLSGKEKEQNMFILLHKYWQKIKNYQLKAADIFDMLQKISVILVDTKNVNNRDIYYSLNKGTKNINQILLIEDYLNNDTTRKTWKEIKKLYKKDADLTLFFKDFFWNKFNFKEFDEDKLYEYFVNYFETMLQYSKPDAVITKLKHSAELYLQLLNITIQDKELKEAMIQLKLHNCEDTYPYLLSAYEDYTDGSLSRATFLEILSTINEYLENREKTDNSVGFNELIQYLNAFIAYK